MTLNFSGGSEGVDFLLALFVANHSVGPAISPCLT
jgi:hypothetical protein